MRIKAVLVTLIVLLLSINLSASSFSFEREFLSCLDHVFVHWEVALPADSVKMIDTTAIRVTVELELRQSNIPLIDSLDHGVGMLSYKVKVEDCPLEDELTGYFWYVRVSCFRHVETLDNCASGFAIVWDDERYFVTLSLTSPKVKEVVLDLAKLFANDYLAANQP